MSGLDALLTGEPVVAAAGADLFADALEAQGARVARADWRPPPDELVWALDAIAARGAAAANTVALERMVGVHPALTGIAAARDVMNMGERTFFHAGPPIGWDERSDHSSISRPVITTAPSGRWPE
jgi:hypothetical protein